MTKGFAIQLENVYFKVDELSILNNITGVFHKGTITALVGPSGSGKTTLLKMCNGLYSPSSGEIYIYDKPIESYEPTELRKKVGIVLQGSPIIRDTVYENLALPYKLQSRQLKESQAISLLEDVGLNHTFLHRQATDLSGGQRQKVSIARTLGNRPEILLLDEITSALDPTSAQEIEQLIIKINHKYHSTIIWITHNIEQAKRIGNYTWVMMDGQLKLNGESSLLWTTSNNLFDKLTIGDKEI